MAGAFCTRCGRSLNLVAGTWASFPQVDARGTRIDENSMTSTDMSTAADDQLVCRSFAILIHKLNGPPFPKGRS
jgi:hypothetical protein